MLGQAVVASLGAAFPSAGIIATKKDSLDISDRSLTEKALCSTPRPDVVINCAAFTKVDLAETETFAAFTANTYGPGILAEACAREEIKLVHFSTDYVFDGSKMEPYTEYDPVNPVSHYGSTKLQGERRVMGASHRNLSIRTSWLFGPGGPNFVKTMILKGRQLGKLRVVDDQIGAPTYTYDLAMGAIRLIQEDATGVVNVTNSGECSWYQFAVEILRIAGLNEVEVTPIPSAEYPTPATRPKNSRLSGARFAAITGQPLRHWREALAEYLARGERGL